MIIFVGNVSEAIQSTNGNSSPNRMLKNIDVGPSLLESSSQERSVDGADSFRYAMENRKEATK
jgi:hypothetical protein